MTPSQQAAVERLSFAIAVAQEVGLTLTYRDGVMRASVGDDPLMFVVDIDEVDDDEWPSTFNGEQP